MVYELLDDPETAAAVSHDLRYVLVDEYQDTNYIQEQLLLKLTETHRNLCVVGDEDQSLYRFRGATVRNILEFAQRMPDCNIVKLTTNYRSHRQIVERYDRWMASADWSNQNGAPFRYNKTIEADETVGHPNYPSVIAIWGQDRRDETSRFADLIEFLKKNEVIADYAQVALLLHSVREEHSGPRSVLMFTFSGRLSIYVERSFSKTLYSRIFSAMGFSTARASKTSAFVDCPVAVLLRDFIFNFSKRILLSCFGELMLKLSPASS